VLARAVIARAVRTHATNNIQKEVPRPTGAPNASTGVAYARDAYLAMLRRTHLHAPHRKPLRSRERGSAGQFRNLSFARGQRFKGGWTS
jgi:hypothetical protein